MKIASEVFENGGRIPPRFTADGENVSPPVLWSDVPDAVGSLALVMEDTDAPHVPRIHWLLYDIPPELKGLLQGPCGVAKCGSNDFCRLGYMGPGSHPGDPQHHYCFRLYAVELDSLGLPVGATHADVEAALAGHVLDEAELIGTYGRTTEPAGAGGVRGRP